MPTDQGALYRQSANRIIAVFVIDDIQRSFSATVSIALPPFTSNSATISYEDVDLLTSTHSYSGRIGPDTFELTLQNGPKITGRLNDPGIVPGVTVDGTGAWQER